MSADAQHPDRFWAAFVSASESEGAAPWPIGVIVCNVTLLFAVLFSVTAYWTVRQVESRLATEVLSGLAAVDISPDNLIFNWHYRDLVVSGNLPPEVSRQQLIDVIKASGDDGVRNISVTVSEPTDISRATPKKGSVDVEVKLINGKISMAGTVLSAAQRLQLVDAASSAVGVYNVESMLRVSGLLEANPGSDERVRSFANSIAGLNKAIAADALLSATDFRFNATVADETQVDELLRRRGTAGDLGLVISGDIIARKSAPGGEIAVAATLSSGRVVLDGVVANQVQKC